MIGARLESSGNSKEARWLEQKHTYKMEYFSAVVNNEILPSATTWMVMEGIKLSKIKTVRQISYDLTYMWKSTNKTNK